MEKAAYLAWWIGNICTGCSGGGLAHARINVGWSTEYIVAAVSICRHCAF